MKYSKTFLLGVEAFVTLLEKQIKVSDYSYIFMEGHSHVIKSVP